MASIINRVDRLSKRFTALRTFEPLVSFACAIVFVGFRMVTVEALHEVSPDSTGFYDGSHVCLVHDQI